MKMSAGIRLLALMVALAMVVGCGEIEQGGEGSSPGFPQSCARATPDFVFSGEVEGKAGTIRSPQPYGQRDCPNAFVVVNENVREPEFNPVVRVSVGE